MASTGAGRAGRRLAIAAALALACATPGPPTAPVDARLAELTSALLELPGAADPAEARRLARAVLAATAELADRYRPLRPPQVGNLAFHVGLRERALCCHWVEDLLRALAGVELHRYELHWVVAHHGDRLREHSAVLALPVGRSPGQGLVLDAWRDSGRLFWVRADADHYPWRLHPADARRDELRCS
jgi:hypothetical protein